MKCAFEKRKLNLHLMGILKSKKPDNYAKIHNSLLGGEVIFEGINNISEIMKFETSQKLRFSIDFVG